MRIPAVLVVVALVMCACSDDDDDTGGEDTQADEVGGDDTASGDAGLSGLPGGVRGKEVLEAHNWLDDEGRLYFGETTPDDEVQEAICDYLFGEPDEVAVTARLGGEVTLEDGSGYAILGGSGTGFRCDYNVSGEIQLALMIWSGGEDETEDTDDADGAQHVVTVDLSDGLQAHSVYGPEYDGEAMTEATARDWLTEAGGRVIGT